MRQHVVALRLYLNTLDAAACSRGNLGQMIVRNCPTFSSLGVTESISMSVRVS